MFNSTDGLCTFAYGSNKELLTLYLHEMKLVSGVYFNGLKYKTKESKYFRFIAEDVNLLNSYSIKKIEEFTVKVFDLFDFPVKLRKKLEKEKIVYYLCSNESEVEKLTGFNTMGMYYLPGDYVVSAYNSHYHELLHLLINYRLQENKLYTHPFFQEGGAVSIGGRGGKFSNVILSMGANIQTCGFMDYRELLSRKSFLSVDPSMSYALSGLYNRFLLEKYGAEKYLSLYKKYSGSLAEIVDMTIDSADLPQSSEFIQYAENFMKIGDVKPCSNEVSGGSTGITCDGEFYKVEMQDTLLIKKEKIKEGYKSRLFKELFPSRVYTGEKYGFIVSKNEISVYNFFTNMLIGKYVRDFASCMPVNDELLNTKCFWVKMSLFDEGEKLIIGENITNK